MNSSDKTPNLREQLDAVRPGSDDLRDVDLCEAARAIDESPEWRDVFELQQAFDSEVVAAMQAVDVPDGLKARLLDSLATAQDVTPVSAAPTADRRRSALKWAAAAAGLLLAVATAFLLVNPDGSQLTLNETRQLLPTSGQGSIDLSALPKFDDNFAVELPDAAWMGQTVMVTELKGLDWTGDNRHDGAIYEFHVNRRIHGYLLILPSTRITDPPASTRMSLSDLGYQPVPNTAWVKPDMHLAYICYVDQGDLETLLHALYPHSA